MTKADCTGNFSCCDCTKSMYFPKDTPICVPDEVVSLFVDTLQCPCQ